MTHPSESGRYYFPDGKPAYEVQGAKGMVKPDIRHAKKLGLVPSVTTIIAEAAKPGLERWKVTQGILAALTLPRVEGESLDDFASRAMHDSQEQAKKASERGTAIHAAIQARDESVVHVGLAVDSHFGPTSWTTEKSFAHPLGFGGKADDHCAIAVIDYKTTEKTEKLETYIEHHMQLSAYREGLGLQRARCAIVYVNVNQPLVSVLEITEEELQRGWLMFQALLSYWQAKTGHKP